MSARQPIPKPGYTPGPRHVDAVQKVTPSAARAIRRAEREAAQFGPHAEIVRRLPCAVCLSRFYEADDDALAPMLELARGDAPGFRNYVSEAHHSRTRGAGGKADVLVPLCRNHHYEAGGVGRTTFARRHGGVDLVALAARLWKLSPVNAGVQS